MDMDDNVFELPNLPERQFQPFQPNYQQQKPIVVGSGSKVGIGRIEAYFEEMKKVGQNDSAKKVTTTKIGTGFLISRNKLITSSSVVLSQESKTIATYILFYPQTQPLDQQKKNIKSKLIFINQAYKFSTSPENSLNYAIIFIQDHQRLSAMTPYQIDWTYDEDIDEKPEIMVEGYQVKEGGKGDQRTVRRFEADGKEQGMMTCSEGKVVEGEEGSPLVRRVEGGQWKVVGLMVRGRDGQQIGLEFGYLVDSKQIDKKQAKSLGQQVLFSIQHSKLYKKLSSSKPPSQPQPPTTISQLQFTLSQKSLRIQQLQIALQSVQQQLMIFTEQEIQNSRLRGGREMRQEIEKLRVELGDARQQRDEALTMLGTKERFLAEFRDEKERMAGEIRIRNEELAARDILIQSLRAQISSLKPPIQPPVSVSHHTQHPNPFLLPIQSQEYYPYIISVFQHPKQKYYHHTPQQLIQAEYMAIALDPLGYKLDHSLVMFDYRVFTQYVWGNLEVLLMEYCNVTNGIWEAIVGAAGCLPVLKILVMKNNPLNRVKPDQLDSFPELRQLTLDKSQFSQTEKTALKTYNQTRDLLSILFE